MLDVSKSIQYWEGFTNFGAVPILHGFNVINRKVIDVTHKVDGKPILGVFDEDKEYIGVQFDVQLVYDRLRNGQESTSFIDNWKENWPIFKEKWSN